MRKLRGVGAKEVNVLTTPSSISRKYHLNKHHGVTESQDKKDVETTRSSRRVTKSGERKTPYETDKAR